jgi:hypothetical protein
VPTAYADRHPFYQQTVAMDLLLILLFKNLLKKLPVQASAIT